MIAKYDYCKNLTTKYDSAFSKYASCLFLMQYFGVPRGIYYMFLEYDAKT